MTKKYNSPMLNVVSINKKDIIATSDPVVGFGNPDVTKDGSQACTAGRRFDDWYEGY